MKRLSSIIFFIAIHCLACFANRGIPFFVNYASDTYKAHNRNFDVVCDDYGTVYVANFEGLLYFDQAQWRMIHTPGISRLTSLFKDKEGRIWVGGYNVFGYLKSKANGVLYIQVLHSDTSKMLLGEVTAISEHNGQIIFQTSDGKSYMASGGKITKLQTVLPKKRKETSLITAANKYNQALRLFNGWQVYATEGKGMVINELGNTYSISEQNGLCNNNINHIAFDGKGGLWGATDNGLCCTNIPSVFSHFSTSEGLKGEVKAINSIGQLIYAGTMQGLFVLKERHFVQIPGVTQACWMLVKNSDGKLYAATSDGLFAVNGNGARRINNHHTLSVLPIDATHFFTGELDGLYMNTLSGQRTKVANIEKAKNIVKDNSGNLWIETIYGQVFMKQPADRQFTNLCIKARLKQEDIVTICNNNGKIGILNNQGLFRWKEKTKSLKLDVIPSKYHFANYPQFIFYDKMGRAWQTNSEGKALGVAYKGKRVTSLDSWLHPLRDLTVNAMDVDKNDIWIGGDFGLIHWACTSKDIEYQQRPTVYIRSIVLGKDSVIWGGYNTIDNMLKPLLTNGGISFSSDERHLHFTFSTDQASIFGKTEYKYRLVGYSEWSAWSSETSADFENLWYGKYEFQVMARDKYGRVANIASYPFSIQYPLFLRWYSVFFYIFILAVIIMVVIRIRMHRLLMEKIRLEKIVEERTSELRQRNEEVEEKSKSLEKALEDLGNAQNELIHQEKMATVGKLTKGLIDRILNPMNYINNFSHLSIGLIKDIGEDLEDEKEKMTPDNFEDAVDVLEMVNSNLEKIEQHGMNTTRILKAMEEMLRERKGNLQEVALAPMFTKVLEVTQSYHAEKIKKYGILVELANCPDSLKIEANAEQLNKTIMSLIDNSIYALVKKYDHHLFSPELKLSVESDDEQNMVKIHIHDNGIGIEKTIIDNIYDPFFTTKTTGEAAGVGLYLSREIILGFGGDIKVDSEKDEYTDFLITLPIKNK